MTRTKSVTFLREDTETPWGTYAAGTPVQVMSTGVDTMVVRLAALPRYPLDLRVPATRVAVKAPPMVDSCNECGQQTMRGWRRGVCAPCTVRLQQLRTRKKALAS